MVAWRPLLQGLFVEAVRLGFALWGQDSTSDFKGSPRSSGWSCEQRKGFWEEQNCSQKLQLLPTCGAELDVCRSQLQSVTRCSIQESFYLGLFCGASSVLAVGALAWSLCSSIGWRMYFHLFFQGWVGAASPRGLLEGRSSPERNVGGDRLR